MAPNLSKIKTVVLFFWVFLLSVPAYVHALEDPTSSIIFQAMEEEMDRSLSGLKIDIFDPPYFVKYQIRHNRHIKIVGSFGSLIQSDNFQDRTLFVDVRIGNEKFDSSTPGSHRHTADQILPLDDDLYVLKRALWYETDLRYKQAIMNFMKKKGRFISGVATHDTPDYSRGHESVVELAAIPDFHPDMEAWNERVRRASALFKQAPEIEKSKVELHVDRTVRYYYDSDGNKIRSHSIHYQLVLGARTKADSGSLIRDQERIFFSRQEDFPSHAELQEKVHQLISNIRELRKSPKTETFVGPALFSPDAAAVLIHEAVGHRLEGDRLRSASDGKTFIKKLGNKILPPFLTIVDNPQIKQVNNTDLVGHYHYDDEGQKGDKVVLIDHGVLKSFLLSRAPVLKGERTNGHARSDGVKAPMSRMANVIVQSELTHSPEKMKRLLIEQIRLQKKPYGLLIKKLSGGETQTQANNFQVFKGKPVYIYKVYPEDGREELVRGVEFVGTPLSMIGKVIATGDDNTVINGFCGAESGMIPVTSVTPSFLLSEVELQTTPDKPLRRPILPPPDL